jgi:hypothetical protein
MGAFKATPAAWSAGATVPSAKPGAEHAALTPTRNNIAPTTVSTVPNLMHFKTAGFVPRAVCVNSRDDWLIY